MNTTTILDHCDIDEYRAWTGRSASPAYMRGIPTWAWRQSARRRRRPGSDRI